MSKCAYDSSAPLHASICQLVFHIDTEVVALRKSPSQRLTSYILGPSSPYCLG